jgi:hypothetical protein
MKLAERCEDFTAESGITLAPLPRSVPFMDPIRLLLSGDPNLDFKLPFPLLPPLKPYAEADEFPKSSGILTISLFFLTSV